jgi:hypothetical protein
MLVHGRRSFNVQVEDDTQWISQELPPRVLLDDGLGFIVGMQRTI